MESESSIQQFKKALDATNVVSKFDYSRLSLKEVYALALCFYKEKQGTVLVLSYADRLKLVAFSKQVAHGKYQPENLPDLGVFDVVGKDRRMAWQQLGEMSKDDGMSGFVSLIDHLCPLFCLYVEAHIRDIEEKEEINRLKKITEDAIKMKEEAEKREEKQRQDIRDALNEQTFPHFIKYVRTQYPEHPDQQALLMRQLQDQHYLQYMKQVYQKQVSKEDGFDCDNGGTENNNSGGEESEANQGSDVDSDEQESSLAISEPSMWTQKDSKKFKEMVRQDGADSVLRVGHGETVTVRVPTHEEGSCVFWEFATDSYDIGFGVHFEWVKSPTGNVSVHISESEGEEEDIDEDDGNEYPSSPDIEQGSISNRRQVEDSRPPTSIIVPVYRRDCHEEVYCGSHIYPGEGIYLLKFDNSYSLWRSKTLYYRVYYTSPDQQSHRCLKLEISTSI